MKILSSILILLILQTGLTAQQFITIDSLSPGKTFEGIGALSAGASSRLLMDYPEGIRNEILDWLFKPGYGAALHHLKVEIGGDVNSTDGTEPSYAHTREEFDHPRNNEWIKLLAQEIKAHQLNTKIVASDEVGAFTVVHEMMKDPELLDAVDVLGTHYQDWNPKNFDAQIVKQAGKGHRVAFPIESGSRHPVRRGSTGNPEPGGLSRWQLLYLP